MALINNLYVFVIDESVQRDVEATTHPVEQGIDLTDHVKPVAISISLKGAIVNYKQGDRTVNYDDILNMLIKLKDSGSLITYIGRNSMQQLQIHSFSTSHPNSIWGGCEFDMELKQVRIAKPALQQKSNYYKTNVGTKQVKSGENKAIYHTVKSGDCIWNLVTKNYKTLDPKYSKTMDKCNWVMQQNPSAFSRSGDFRTLQIGEKILIGYRA